MVLFHLASIEFTEDGSKAVYLISEGGSDWRKARIIDTETKEIIEPELVDIKFSGLSWLNNEGFTTQVMTSQKVVSFLLKRTNINFIIIN